MASVTIAVVGSVVGWILSVPWQLGLFAGLVAWVVLSNGALTLGRTAVRKEETANAEELEQFVTKLNKVKQERDELEAENQQLRDRPGDEALKQESRRLSGELFLFTEKRDKDDPQHDPNFPGWEIEDQEGYDLNQAKMRHDEETWSRYRKEYEGKVRALLNALERRDWLDAQERKEIEGELDVFWHSPSQRMERVAARLDAFGKRM